MCISPIEKYGAKPANVQWSVVRGDTGTLKIEFLNSDEITVFDTSAWTYKATAYDPSGEVLDDIPVEISEGYVTIVAPASLTSYWGTTYRSVVAELPFDLQATIPSEGEDIVWTPVVGTICVLGNVTPGGSL